LHLVFDICTGIGVAAAVGIRPFLPSAVVGLLAAESVQIHFKGTDYSFLQSLPFLLVLLVLGIIFAVADRRFGLMERSRGPAALALAAAALALGALLFAGSLARDHYAAWPGFIGGVICAAVGLMATRPLFARVRARLDTEAAGAVPFYAEGAGVLLGALSVVAPPVGVIGLLLLGWLLVGGRRREGQKYAGLRILR
jgi:hypothetical protein